MSKDLFESNLNARYEDSLCLVDKTESLLKASDKKINIIKSVFGKNSEEYLNISNEIAQISMACLVNAYNKFGDRLNGHYPYSKNYEKVLGQQKRIKWLFEKIDSLEMDYETRERYENNIKVLKGNSEDNGNSSEDSHWLLEENGMADKVNDVVTGCYIATMVYGDYNHPQVLVLRDFRDRFLTNFFLGKSFIKFYYKYSPGLVKVLENKKTFNNIIKGILNIIINFIR